MKYDLNIEHQSLNDLIKVIGTDINNFEDIFKKCTETIKKLDDIWIGPDKTKSDEEYFSYIEEIDKIFVNNLRNCLNVLTKANILYQDTNMNIEKNTSNLES